MNSDNKNDPNATQPSRGPMNPSLPSTPGNRPQQGGSGRSPDTTRPDGKDNSRGSEDVGGGRKQGSDTSRPGGGSSSSGDPSGRSKAVEGDSDSESDVSDSDDQNQSTHKGR